MSLPRYFLETQIIANERLEPFQLQLSSDDAHHFQVTRIARGEHIAVIDASSDYFELEVTDIFNNEIWVKIAQRQIVQSRDYSIHLYQGLAKGDKVDTVIRQATEIGVSGFTIFSSSRAVVRLDEKKALAKQKRWRAIAKSAAMQSGQNFIPEINQPCSLKSVLDSMKNHDALIVFWEEAETSVGVGQVLKTLLPQKFDIANENYALNLPLHDSEGLCGDDTITTPTAFSVGVVIGPEGGLSEDEVNIILSANKNSGLASLGSSILRTETAGVIACALVIYECGGLGNTHKNAREVIE